MKFTFLKLLLVLVLCATVQADNAITDGFEDNSVPKTQMLQQSAGISFGKVWMPILVSAITAWILI